MLLLEDKMTKIVNALDIKYEFGYNLSEDDSYTVLDPVRNDLYAAGITDCSVDCGVSKVVIIPKQSAYVIKTPLFGDLYYPEEFNSETDEYYYDYDNPKFSVYEGAYYGGADELDHSNYCELEEFLYNLAEDYNVAEMFAKTEFFCYGKNNRPMYLSEKCRPFSWDDREPSENSKTIVRTNISSKTPGWRRMDSFIAALFVDDYGVEKTNELFEFIADHNIDDLHSGNIMFSEKTGKIVISDYSGFDS